MHLCIVDLLCFNYREKIIVYCKWSNYIMEPLDLIRYGLEEQKNTDIELHIVVFHEGNLQGTEI